MLCDINFVIKPHARFPRHSIPLPGHFYTGRREMTPVQQQSGQNDIILWPGYKCRRTRGQWLQNTNCWYLHTSHIVLIQVTWQPSIVVYTSFNTVWSLGFFCVFLIPLSQWFPINSPNKSTNDLPRNWQLQKSGNDCLVRWSYSTRCQQTKGCHRTTSCLWCFLTVQSAYCVLYTVPLFTLTNGFLVYDFNT